MNNRLIPKKSLGGAVGGLNSMFSSSSLTPNKSVDSLFQNVSSGIGKASGAMLKAKDMAKSFDSFSLGSVGGMVSSGLDLFSNALGIKPQYNLNSKLDKGLGAAEKFSKNFGNPLLNAATDFASNGIGKLMGLNTNKVVGGGMAGVNAVSNVLSLFGPIGMIASTALKIGNMVGGKNLSKLSVDTRVQNSGSYTGSAANIKGTSDKYSGGMVSGVDRLFGQDKKYELRLADARNTQMKVKGVLNAADENSAAQTGSQDMFRIKNQMNMQDNSYMFNGALSAKYGGRILRIIKAQAGAKYLTHENLLVSDINKKYKDVNFLKRLNATLFTTIPDWKDLNSQASHKLSYTGSDGKFYVYPEVQEINGKLHDFTDPNNKHYDGENYRWRDAIDSAFKNNDVIPFNTEEEAAWFTSNLYKRFFPATKGLNIEPKNISDFVNKHQGGGKVDNEFEIFRKSLPISLQDSSNYRLKRFWELNGKVKDFNALKALNVGEQQSDGYHLPTVGYNKELDEYEFLKHPNHPTIGLELDWYNSEDGKDFRNDYDLDKSGEFYKYTRKKSQKFADGGKMNIIPEGALHAHKHHLEIDDITHKGIPVISHEEGGEVTLHAEIERNEIVFTKEVTDKLEKFWKEFNNDDLTKKEKDEIAIKAGELLTFEIIENTDDRTGLIAKVD